LFNIRQARLSAPDLELVVRPRPTRQLAVWMNGDRVGEGRVPGRGPQEFHDDPAWLS
jgi:hypothetical protein